jgi:MFS superfamily sulfate permease-like transporter
MLPLIAYFLFGSSRQVVVGPDSAMAAIVAVTVAPMAMGDPGRLALLCATLGVMVGVLCLLAGLLRLGFVANFLSKPVIVGFMHGIALVIIGSQLSKVLGIRGEGETTLEQVASLVLRLGDTNPVSLAIGAASFALILLCKRFVPRVPGAVVALVGALLAVVLLGLDRYGIAVIGRIRTGLPQLTLPTPTLGDFDDLLAVALAAALLSFSDTMVTARAFAARNGYRIEANQELLGIGMAYLVSGVSQGAAGGQTRRSGRGPRPRRFRGISLAGALVTLLGVVMLGLMEGILLGVVFSLVLLLRALAFPPDALLGRTPAGEWHDPAHRPEAVPVPGLLVYRFSAPLFFANGERFRERIEALVAERHRAGDGRGGGRRRHPRRRHHGLRHAGRARQRAPEPRHPARLRQSARPGPARHRARPAVAAGGRGGVLPERRRRRRGCRRETRSARLIGPF